MNGSLLRGPTESPKKYETWKTTWGLLTDFLERKKGPQLKQQWETFV